jgi:hypothetical protein
MAVWKQKVDVSDVFYDDAMALPQKGEAIVAQLRRLRPEGEDLVLDELLEELADAAREGDVRWFDDVWDGVYDWADAERVWIETV